MQQTTGVAVLATQLAQTDRRALSQAWYDALHLARNAAPTRSGAAPRAFHASPPLARATSAPVPARLRVAADAAYERHAGGARRAPASPGLERRAPKCELADRIERALARRIPRAAAASFAVQIADGRVRILVRSDGERTRVLAVCAPPLRERVERALARARFALAARGVRVEAG
jgi:hypothetical protein